MLAICESVYSMCRHHVNINVNKRTPNSSTHEFCGKRYVCFVWNQECVFRFKVGHLLFKYGLIFTFVVPLSMLNFFNIVSSVNRVSISKTESFDCVCVCVCQSQDGAGEYVWWGCGIVPSSSLIGCQDCLGVCRAMNRKCRLKWHPHCRSTWSKHKTCKPNLIQRRHVDMHCFGSGAWLRITKLAEKTVEQCLEHLQM